MSTLRITSVSVLLNSIFFCLKEQSHHCTRLFLSCSYEAEAVRRCLVDGKTECETIPLDESLIIAETMDSILEQLGVKY